MMEKVYRSKCCKAKVRAAKLPEFWRNSLTYTVYYVCRKCDKPCDVVVPKGQQQKALKKRTKKGERRLDFQGEMLQKLNDLLDGIIINPIKGVILTSKKKRQLAELLEMQLKLSKSKNKEPHK